MDTWQHECEALATRIRTLEQDSRRARIRERVAWVALAALSAGWLAGGGLLNAQGSRQVEGQMVVRTLIVADAAGRPRAVLGTMADGVRFGLNDAAGQPRLLMGVSDKDNSSELTLLGPDKSFPRIVLAQRGSDFQMITLEDASSSFVGLVHRPADEVKLWLARGDMLAEFGLLDGVDFGVKVSEQLLCKPRLLLKDGKSIVTRLPAASPAPRVSPK